jgi:Ca2+/H+ antiporter
MCNFSISALNIQSNQCCVHLLHSWIIVPTRVHVLSHVCLLAFPGTLKRRQQQREAVKSQVQAQMFCFVILSLLTFVVFSSTVLKSHLQTFSLSSPQHHDDDDDDDDDDDVVVVAAAAYLPFFPGLI